MTASVNDGAGREKLRAQFLLRNFEREHAASLNNVKRAFTVYFGNPSDNRLDVMCTSILGGREEGETNELMCCARAWREDHIGGIETKPSM